MISPCTNQYPATHKGGINAVAIATPGTTVRDFSFLLSAIAPTNHPAIAIPISQIAGEVLAMISFVAVWIGLIQKYIPDTMIARTKAVTRFLNHLRTISIS